MHEPIAVLIKGKVHISCAEKTLCNGHEFLVKEPAQWFKAEGHVRIKDLCKRCFGDTDPVEFGLIVIE